MKFPSKSDKRRRAIAAGYRSGLEEDVARSLTAMQISFGYEVEVIRYTPPQKTRRYTPDFVFRKLDVLCPLCEGKGEKGTCWLCHGDHCDRLFVETKGLFKSGDRVKHLAIQAEFPWLDIRFVFTNPSGKLNKGSKTTYSTWCETHGFRWASRGIPQEWLDEVG